MVSGVYVCDFESPEAESIASVLVDEDSTKTGDLYIRSVCFSPDGKYLATGAEDKQIRVSTRQNPPEAPC